MGSISDVLVPNRRANENALRGALEQKRAEAEAKEKALTNLQSQLDGKKRELSYAHSALEEERARRKAAEERIRQEWRAKKEAQRKWTLREFQASSLRKSKQALDSRHRRLLQKFGDTNARLKKTGEVNGKLEEHIRWMSQRLGTVDRQASYDKGWIADMEKTIARLSDRCKTLESRIGRVIDEAYNEGLKSGIVRGSNVDRSDGDLKARLAHRLGDWTMQIPRGGFRKVQVRKIWNDNRSDGGQTPSAEGKNSMDP